MLKFISRFNRRRRPSILNSLMKRWITGELTTVFDTWSLFENFNNALVLLKQLWCLCRSESLKKSPRLSASSRRSWLDTWKRDAAIVTVVYTEHYEAS